MQPRVIMLDGPLAGQRVKAALTAEIHKHRSPDGTLTEYRLDFVVLFRHHLRVGWSSRDREPPVFGCARWLTSEVVKEQLDDLWRGSGVGQLTQGARVAAAEYKANAAIPPLDPILVDPDTLAEVVDRVEAYLQARRRAGVKAFSPREKGTVAAALVIDDGPEDGQGYTRLFEDDLVLLVQAARKEIENR